MTKYCPTCDTEYKNSQTHCADDGALLAPVQVEHEDPINYVNIYAASSEIEAERIVAFLEENHIPAHVEKHNISQLPLLADTHFIIAVQTTHEEEARGFIHNAQRDEVISTTGVFL